MRVRWFNAEDNRAELLSVAYAYIDDDEGGKLCLEDFLEGEFAATYIVQCTRGRSEELMDKLFREGFLDLVHEHVECVWGEDED